MQNSIYNSEELVLFRDQLRKYIESEIVPHGDEWEKIGKVPREVFTKMGELGFLGLRYGEQYGGSELDTVATAVLAEELGRSTFSGFAISVLVHTDMASPHLNNAGNDDQRAKYMPGIITGETVTAVAVTEPDAGSDVAGIKTRAIKDGDDWVLNGSKMFITNGPVADFYTVLMQTDPKKKFRGLNFFFVPRDTPGFSCGKPFDLLGTRSTPISEVAFKDCMVPHTHMLGAEGKGLSNLLSILAEIRTMTAALAVGLQRAAMDDSIQYAHERAQFGQTISNYQLIQAKVANLAVDLEASKLLTYKASHMIDDKEEALKEASMAKYFATEAATRAGDQATRILGAYAYSMEYSAQRYYRDNRFLLYGGGTHEILQPNIAKWVGL